MSNKQKGKVILMVPSSDILKLPTPSRNVLISPRMRRVLAYIELNYAQEITLRNVALLFGIHPAYLCRKFKKEMGISFHKYLLKARLQIASSLLVTTEKSVKEISYSVGFSRPEIFSKAFKRLTGCSPKTYRTQTLSISEDPDAGVPFLEIQRTVSMPTRPEVFSVQPLQMDLNVKK